MTLIAGLLVSGLSSSSELAIHNHEIRLLHLGNQEPQATIQSAIDQAVSGDSILVGEGLYRESINLGGKSIALIATKGPQFTTIDGSDAEGRSVIYITSGEDRNTLIQGFTIRGGRTDAESVRLPTGGGITIHDAEPTIRGNLITENYSEYQYERSRLGVGGGIACYGSTSTMTWRPVIEDNTISSNVSGNQGGGIFAAGYMAPEIINNTILDNVVTSGDGGGISIMVGTDGTIVSGNTITGNICGDHGGGLLVVMNAGQRGPMDFTVSNNLISLNTARHKSHIEGCGSGALFYNSQGLVVNNTIAGNSCEGSRGLAAAPITIHGEGTTRLQRNIVTSGSERCLVRSHPPADVSLLGNLFWSTAEDESACPSYPSEGALWADPLFCDVSLGHYTLSQHSPALTHPLAPLGFSAAPECSRRTVRLSWGLLKSRSH